LAGSPDWRNLTASAKRRLLERLRATPKRSTDTDRARIETDWQTWYAAVFGPDFVAALADHHREAVEWHWNARQALLRGEIPEYLAYFSIWSRGHLKSTVARRIAVCDAALSVNHGGGYCLYVSGTKAKVRGHALSIETLITQPGVKKYYPALSQVRRSAQGNSKGWTSDFIYTDAGYVFHFIGLDEGVAGANVDDVRPTLIIPDDIDDREDSPAISERRFQVFTKAVLPTRQRNTLVFCAQNLVSRFGVIFRIWKGKARVLVNRMLTDPIPAIRGLVTEPRTVKGIVKDVILAGEPTWPLYDLQRAQEEIDTIGLPAFLSECQHEVEQQKQGLILPEWDEAVHLITWSEFQRVYGVREIPRHWHKYVGHDWGNTHPCVVSCLTTSSQNSRLPGLHFLFAGLTFPQNTLADDVALAIINRLAPAVDTSAMRRIPPDLLAKWAADRVTNILNAPRQVAVQRIRVKVLEWLASKPGYVKWCMSHEQLTIRQTYHAVYGLPFQPCNPGASGGIEQLRHFLRVDYSQQHPFRPGAKGLSGMYFIVADDQLNEARDDLGLKLWREQFPDWSWRQLNLTELGLQQDKPMKVNDDTGNSLMMVTSHFTLGPAKLTIDEQIQSNMPATWRDGHLSQLDPDIAQRYEDARREELQEIKRSLMKKRRPDYYGLGDDDEDYGGVDDCF